MIFGKMKRGLVDDYCSGCSLQCDLPMSCFMCNSRFCDECQKEKVRHCDCKGGVAWCLQCNDKVYRCEFGEGKGCDARMCHLCYYTCSKCGRAECAKHRDANEWCTNCRSIWRYCAVHGIQSTVSSAPECDACGIRPCFDGICSIECMCGSQVLVCDKCGSQTCRIHATSLGRYRTGTGFDPRSAYLYTKDIQRAAKALLLMHKRRDTIVSSLPKVLVMKIIQAL
jgi:hypothetical protein